jgi:hypothetical protein
MLGVSESCPDSLFQHDALASVQARWTAYRIEAHHPLIEQLGEAKNFWPSAASL